MNDMEKMVWAAAYAAEFNRIRAFYDNHPKAGWDVTHIHGFTCAEIADVALEKYREAIKGPDAEYLIPVKEGATDV